MGKDRTADDVKRIKHGHDHSHPDPVPHLGVADDHGPEAPHAHVHIQGGPNPYNHGDCPGVGGGHTHDDPLDDDHLKLNPGAADDHG
jgi:hypothetical protein